VDRKHSSFAAPAVPSQSEWGLAAAKVFMLDLRASPPPSSRLVLRASAIFEDGRPLPACPFNCGGGVGCTTLQGETTAILDLNGFASFRRLQFSEHCTSEAFEGKRFRILVEPLDAHERAQAPEMGVLSQPVRVRPLPAKPCSGKDASKDASKDAAPSATPHPSQSQDPMPISAHVLTNNADGPAKLPHPSRLASANDAIEDALHRAADGPSIFDPHFGRAPTGEQANLQMSSSLALPDPFEALSTHGRVQGVTREQLSAALWADDPGDGARAGYDLAHAPILDTVLCLGGPSCKWCVGCATR